MLKIHRINLIILRILLGVILDTTACHHIRQSVNLLGDINKNNRGRRGSIFLALKPHESDGLIHRGNEAHYEQFSLDTDETSYQIPMKIKRESPETSQPQVYTPEMKHYMPSNIDFLNNQYKADVAQDEEKFVDNIGIRKNERNVAGLMPIVFVPRVRRTIQDGRPTCYCQECKTSQCHHCNPLKQQKFPVNLVMNDNSEEDTSEEVSEPLSNSGSKLPNDPTKFNIPLTTSKSSNSKNSREQYSSNDEGLFPSSPYVIRGSYSGEIQNQWNNAFNVKTSTTDEPKFLTNNEKCTGAACSAKTSNTATGVVEAIHLSDKDSSKMHLDEKENTTSRILAESYENEASAPLMYSPRYAYQTTKPTAQQVHFNIGLRLKNVGIASNSDAQTQKFQGNKIYHNYHSIPRDSVDTGYANVNPQSYEDSKYTQNPKSDESDKSIEVNGQNVLHVTKYSPTRTINHDQDQTHRPLSNHLKQIPSTSSEKPDVTIYESPLRSLNLNSNLINVVKDDDSHETTEQTSNLKLKGASNAIENDSVPNHLPRNNIYNDTVSDNIESEDLIQPFSANDNNVLQNSDDTVKVKNPRSANRETLYHLSNLQNDQEKEVLIRTLESYYRANGHPGFTAGENLVFTNPTHDVRVPQIMNKKTFARDNIHQGAKTYSNSGIKRNYVYYQVPLTTYGNTVYKNVNNQKVQNEKSAEFKQNPSHSIKYTRSRNAYAPAYQYPSPKPQYYTDDMENLNSYTNINNPNAQRKIDENSVSDLFDFLDQKSQVQENSLNTASQQEQNSEQFLALKIRAANQKSSSPSDKQRNILQNTVKTVINNFVPGKVQDLIVNYETGVDLENFVRAVEDFQPEILDTPVLRSLLSVPEIEDMIVDTASNFLSQITGRSIGSGAQNLIKNTLHEVIKEIPQNPIVFPTAVGKRDSDENQWVTERVTRLTSSRPSFEQKGPPTEVFDAIKSIISKSTLEEDAVAQPLVKNFIIKATKHQLDKKKGAIDEFTIRQAFNLLVQPNNAIKTGVGLEGGPTLIKDKQKAFGDSIRKIENHGDRVSVDRTSIVTTVPLDYMAVGSPTKVAGNSARAGSTSTKLNHREQAAEPTSTENSNRYSLLIEPTTDSSEPRTPRDGEDSMPSDQPYLGQLVPLESLEGDKDSQLLWVGDGVRLPLTARKLPNGSFALTLSDDLCQRFVNRRCPCCLPTEGSIVRERRSQRVHVDKGSEDARDEAVGETSRFRRESTEVLRDDKLEIGTNIGEFLNYLNRAKDSNDASTNTIRKSPMRGTNRDRIVFAYDRNYMKQPDFSMIRFPYRYQRYANEDQLISTKTRALQNMLYWMKDIATKASQNKT